MKANLRTAASIALAIFLVLTFPKTIGMIVTVLFILRLGKAFEKAL